MLLFRACSMTNLALSLNQEEPKLQRKKNSSLAHMAQHRLAMCYRRRVVLRLDALLPRKTSLSLFLLLLLVIVVFFPFFFLSYNAVAALPSGFTALRMAIDFILFVNKQGETRLSQYSKFIPIHQRTALEADVVRVCLQRRETDCNFVDYMQYRLAYRRYASLFCIVGFSTGSLSWKVSAASLEDGADNELGVLEFIHCVVEVLDKYFENVCELDLLFNVEKAHFLLQEMLCNGMVAESNHANVLQNTIIMDREERPAPPQ